MSNQQLLFDRVSFYYDTLSEPVFDNLTLRLGPGFTGIVGPNGAGKSTLLRLATGELTPQQGRIRFPGRAVACAQRTDAPPTDFRALMTARDPSACRLRGRLRLDPAWPDRWRTLSHGERKRCQIATALWRQPHLLTVDEPSNHLDEQACTLLFAALGSYDGIGLVVSHNRRLLDTLCERIVWLEPPDVTVYPGGYSRARRQRETDRTHRRHQRKGIQQGLSRLQREQSAHRRAVLQSKRRLSKQGLRSGDADQRARRNLACHTGKDGQPGRRLHRLAAKEKGLHTELENARVRREAAYRINLTGQCYGGDSLLMLSPTRIPLGPGRSLQTPELTLRPRARIGLVGPNGSGKTTLVRTIVNDLGLPVSRRVYVPQELTAEQARATIASVRTLPHSTLGDLMTFVGGLGSDPQRLLKTRQPSPGETRKLLLALGMLAAPYLVIMDEPTNHLDLPSIEALERALQACECALLLVSHDRGFLNSLVTHYWEVSKRAGNDGEWVLGIRDGVDV
jgi:ATPase subunit of ABC transporter with duplicated ATPase domains